MKYIWELNFNSWIFVYCWVFVKENEFVIFVVYCYWILFFEILIILLIFDFVGLLERKIILSLFFVLIVFYLLLVRGMGGFIFDLMLILFSSYIVSCWYFVMICWVLGYFVVDRNFLISLFECTRNLDVLLWFLDCYWWYDEIVDDVFIGFLLVNRVSFGSYGSSFFFVDGIFFLVNWIILLWILYVIL